MTEPVPVPEVTDAHQRILDRFADFTDTLVTYVRRAGSDAEPDTAYMMHAGAFLFALTLLPPSHAGLLEDLDQQASVALDAAFDQAVDTAIAAIDPKVPRA
jgi:hypothetical protein